MRKNCGWRGMSRGAEERRRRGAGEKKIADGGRRNLGLTGGGGACAVEYC